MSEVTRYWPEEVVGTGELVVYLSDYTALEAECERLQAEFKELLLIMNTIIQNAEYVNPLVKDTVQANVSHLLGYPKNRELPS